MSYVIFLQMTSPDCTVGIAHLYIVIEEQVYLEAINCDVDIFSELCSHEICEEMYNLIFVKQMHR